MATQGPSRSVYAFVAGAAVGLFLATVGFALVLKSSSGPGGGGKAGGGARTLTLAHVLEPTHPVHLGMEHMAKRVDELSGGALQLIVYHSGQLGTETDCLERLQAGSLDITKVSTASLESFVPEMAVFGMPYVFRDHDHFWNVLKSPIGEKLLQGGQSANVHGLCYFDAGARSFYTTSKPILSPADVRGMKIRVLRSKTAMDMIEAMGGLPTPIAWGELYTAIQQRMVDGAENNPPSFVSSRHYEVAKHYTLNEHTHTPDIVLMATNTWASLDAAQRQVVEQAARESSDFQRKLWEEKSKQDMELLANQGVKIYKVDQEPFRKAVEPMIRSYDGTPAGAIIEQIRKVP